MVSTTQAKQKKTHDLRKADGIEGTRAAPFSFVGRKWKTGSGRRRLRPMGRSNAASPTARAPKRPPGFEAQQFLLAMGLSGRRALCPLIGWPHPFLFVALIVDRMNPSRRSIGVGASSEKDAGWWKKKVAAAAAGPPSQRTDDDGGPERRLHSTTHSLTHLIPIPPAPQQTPTPSQP